MRTVRHRERGAFAVWFAVLAPVILAAFALALETTYLLTMQHRQQLATDMAVTSAGLQLLREDQTAALAAAEASLYTHGIETTNVDLVLSETESGQSYRLTVTSAPLRLLTRFLSTEEFGIVTKASARMRRSNCLLALAASGTGLQIAANANILGETCNAQVNSATFGSANAAIVVSNKAVVALHSIRAVGGASIAASATVTPSVVTGAAADADPLLDMTEPAFSTCNYTDMVVSGTRTLSPGTYCGGITINANSTANLLPGNYLLYQGDLSSKRRAALTGDGVTVFLLGGGVVNLEPTTMLDLGAATSGEHAGILLFESRLTALDVNTHIVPVLNKAKVDGLLYTPNSTLRVLTDSNTPTNEAAFSSSVIAYRVVLEGRLTFPSEEGYLATGMGQRVWLSE